MRSSHAALAAALLAVLPSPSAAQSGAPLELAQYLDLETVAEPRLSPDGRRIIYTRRWVDQSADRWTTALWLMEADGARQRFLAEGSGVVWSPDGARIAYIAEGEGGSPQIFVRWMTGDGAVTQVTREPTAPGNLQWAPDGRMIGFTRFVPDTARWTVDLPPLARGVTRTAEPRVVDRLHNRQDRRGFHEPGGFQLFVVPADGGTGRQVTRGEWHVGARFDGLTGQVGWAWMPDGRSIVVDGYEGIDADLNYRLADIWRVDIETGARMKLTTEPGTWSNPKVSPDGKWLAYGGYPATRATYQAAALWLRRLDRDEPARALTTGLDRDPADIMWAHDSDGLYFTAEDQGSRNLYHVSRGGDARPVTTGAHLVSLGDLGRQVAVVVRTTPSRPGDIALVNLRRPAEMTWLTEVNRDLLHGVRLGEVEEIRYRSSGDARIQGWIVKPPDFDPAKRYPLILEIHGGPHAMYNVGFNFFFQSFARAGYVVLYTNPRGSTGYGSAFGNAIDQAYPSVDYDDLMAGVDTVVGRGYVDTARMYVGGCSGGGVLSSWVIGHTDRFAAAAVRCPVTNWLSFAGQTDVPLFTHNFFRAPFWESPEQWLRQSPLMYVGRVTTPTLLMTGVLDLRTPMPQTEEYFAALRMRGVPSVLLRFEGEYHGTTSRPSNFLRTVLYMLDWYGRWSEAGERAAP